MSRLLRSYVAATLVAAGAHPAVAQILPDRLSDSSFWSLINTLSEPGGSFVSDNFVSNERMYQRAIPELRRATSSGGVYIGVGPEQNLTYIAALEPRMAFIIDIRRQNLVEHLMYKALMELSGNRADFLAMLFSRPRPPGLSDATDVTRLLAAFVAVSPDSMAYKTHLAAIRRHLWKTHGFALSADDSISLDDVYSSFFRLGPSNKYTLRDASSPWGPLGRDGKSGISYATGGQLLTARLPDFAEVMTQTDGSGHYRAFIATEDAYRLVRELEVRNLIVPVTGDFAGPKAVRAVGSYLREHQATVGVFYVSNVEQYLFGQPGMTVSSPFERWIANVRSLPIDAASVFIRSVADDRPPGESFPRVLSIENQLVAVRSGRVRTYQDLLQSSH